MRDKIVAIVLAAGEGKRMGSGIPKQYMIIKSKPLIYYALKSFQQSDVDEVVLVTGEDEIDYCQTYIVDKYNFTKVKKIVAGGRERAESVYLGLKNCKTADYVLIHDGARPMLDRELISKCIMSVKKDKACIVGMPAKDTIKQVDYDNVVVDTPKRQFLWQVQTPQCFEYNLVYEAHKRLMEDGNLKEATDDGSVVEMYTDTKVKLIHGSYDNIKITTPEDMKIANSLMKVRKLFHWLHLLHDKIIYMQMIFLKKHQQRQKRENEKK